ncbi:hypothetical protein ACN28E_25005 [Archangium lansingense]|uniref:hypothetical protein n=1 Tax=Archangium lansingense TaxID=2995310 RepID=UPI003B77C921
MARPRGYDEEVLSRDDGEKPRRGRPPKEKKPAPSYHPPKKPRGPATTLTEEMIPIIARDVGRGASRAAAAASVRTTEDCLNQWLQRGRRHVAEGTESLYASLLLECASASREYELHLLDLGDAAAQDKTLNVRWVTWRLGFLRPQEFTARAIEGPANGSGFALMSPEEAVQSVQALMAEFLARNKPGGGDASGG